MAQVLTQQQRSLDLLARTVDKDLATMDVIRAGFGLPPAATSPSARLVNS